MDEYLIFNTWPILKGFKCLPSLTLKGTHTHTHIHNIAPTPTHKPVSAPSPPCFFPPCIPADWGAVYRNLPVLSYPLSFLPSILFCITACLSGCLPPVLVSHSLCRSPLSASSPCHLSPLKNCKWGECLERSVTQDDCLTHELKMSHVHGYTHTYTHDQKKITLYRMIRTGIMPIQGDSESWDFRQKPSYCLP